MRSGRVFILSLLLVSATAAAYNGEGNRLVMGVKGGLGLSSFWGNGLMQFEQSIIDDPVTQIDPAMLISPTAGFFISLGVIPDFLVIQPELLYVRSGKNWEATALGGARTSFKIYTDYVMVPVLAKLLIPFAAPIMPSAYAGPEVAMKLRARADGLADLPSGANLGFAQSFAAQEDINESVNMFDIGLATGISFDFFAGPGAFILDFRYTFGFLNIYDVAGGDDIRNSIFSILGGYAFMF